ncbi:nucleotidyltransferase domain-containing protein [candidate division WOR-3 bacterium]|nr:nucleotidyltransferase domain-containing protein [candidate division WOR-3 bacterium]
MAVTSEAYGAEIDELVRRVVTRFKPLQVVLFGSRVRGTAGPDSDADVLVVMPVQGSRRDVATAIDVALVGIDLPVDVIVVTPEDVDRSRNDAGSVVHEALTEGKVLYERS